MVADKVLRRPGDGTTLVEAMEAGLAAVCHSNWQVPARLRSDGTRSSIGLGWVQGRVSAMD